ncbi:HNH endonuclease [Enterovibrio norvegicus]|uniref:TIGR02646 family protein n=1 Tax=Enterovibrio norvegicus DSM 15893 TaxID=1121869 RepID=A0A1I5PH77_9GAMM|nr:HNH endonuclease [Enterovibrio norvegicus]SFP33197.1 TIGR02646 family protein [Enterovibrio norvegicus DSM 15893]
MRPIRKADSPIAGDFNAYGDAKPELVSRLGKYCSYCERRIETLLAVEHIEPKDGDNGKPHLEKRWSNFLLACTNCNSCKGSKAVDFQSLIFPDRDNTFFAYIYTDDGRVESSSLLTAAQKTIADNTLNLLGLDKKRQEFTDSNGALVALDRVSQRMEMISTAQVSLAILESDPTNEGFKVLIVNQALASGFFSIWMKVFAMHPDMKLRFINAFKGTAESNCFNIANGQPVKPAPNPDQLAHGGKV